MKKKIIVLGILVWLIIMFILSIQSPKGTSELTYFLKKSLLRLLQLDWNEGKKYWWFEIGHLRKIAHSIEYFALGMFVAVLTRKRKIWFPIVTCFLISILDQLIKGIIPTREFDVTDLPFDFIGYFGGIVIVYLVCFIVRSIKNQKNSISQRCLCKR